MREDEGEGERGGEREVRVIEGELEWVRGCIDRVCR